MQAYIAPPIESDADLQDLYNWVDEIPLSRPKRNIARDFADGVLCAEIVSHFFPKLVEIHNYSSANSNSQKMYNWNTLNQKVLKKLGFQIHQQDLDDVIKAGPGAIERVLKLIQDRIMQAQRGGLPRRASAAERMPGSTPETQPAESRQPAGETSRQQDQGRPPAAAVQRYQQEVDAELLVEKEQTISELREMVSIMSEKIKKLEQLVRIKESKIEALNQKLHKYGLG